MQKKLELLNLTIDKLNSIFATMDQGGFNEEIKKEILKAGMKTDNQVLFETLPDIEKMGLNYKLLYIKEAERILEEMREDIENKKSARGKNK